MGFSWVREDTATWDEDKARIVGGAAEGIFDTRFGSAAPGSIVPAEWWRVEDGGEVVGYGWLDVTWGDAEILLATAEGARGRGVGAFILERLEDEARARGLNYLYNVVRPTHPEGERVSVWLVKHGFERASDGRLLRAVPQA